MHILVTGGAGYIGSHIAKELSRAGHLPVVLDNLSRGHRRAVEWGPLVEMDLAGLPANCAILKDYAIDAVIHVAAYAYVGESIVRPAEYFANNVTSTLSLLEAMRAAGLNRIIFSSTCATYGNPVSVPISECHPQQPVNPYGESKRMVERILEWYGQAYGLSWLTLRYFNAAGADPEGEIGEDHDPETHLIPRAIAAATGELPCLEIFGSDYETPDGTAIRDYVHVTDLARAHVAAVTKLARGCRSEALNLGTGKGYSVKQVVAAVEEAVGRRVPVAFRPRRSGDPSVLIADASRAPASLGWSPDLSTLEYIVKTAVQWSLKPKKGLVQKAAQVAAI